MAVAECMDSPAAAAMAEAGAAMAITVGAARTGDKGAGAGTGEAEDREIDMVPAVSRIVDLAVGDRVDPAAGSANGMLANGVVSGGAVSAVAVRLAGRAARRSAGSAVGGR